MVELANRLYDFEIQRDSEKALKNTNTMKDMKYLNNLKKMKSSKFRKSQINNGKVLVREDLGLIPLQHIKKILQQCRKPDPKEPIQLHQTIIQLVWKSEIPMLGSSPSHQKKKSQQTDVFHLDKQDVINDLNIKLSDICIERNVSMPQAQQQIFTQSDEITNTFQKRYENQTRSINTQQSEGDTILQQSTVSQSNQNSPNNQSIYQQNRQTLFQMGLIDTKSFLEKEINFILLRSREIKLKFLFLLNKLTCHKLFNTKIVQLLRRAEKMVLKDLDVFTIVDKLKQLEKLKKLILTKEQETLFNFFPKPLISLSSQENEFNKEMLKEEFKSDKKDQKKKKKSKDKPNKLAMITKAIQKFKKIRIYNSISKYQELFECYQNLLNQNRTKSEAFLNQKLIQHLGEEMNNIFEVADLMNNFLFKRNKNYAPSTKYAIQPDKSIFSIEKRIDEQEIELSPCILKMQEQQQNYNLDQVIIPLEQINIPIEQVADSQ